MRAVLFDIYETLLTAIPLTPEARRCNLRLLASRYGIEPTLDLPEQFRSEVARRHQESPFPYPEVDARKIWRCILPSLRDPAAFAEDYEDAVHPVRAVEGAKTVLRQLHEMNVLLGIVSNAQAYTHRLLERELGNVHECFDERLLGFSYQHLRAKPDPVLFQIAISPLIEHGCKPSDILMIGDSETNDIIPAQKLGLSVHRVQPGVLSCPTIYRAAQGESR